MDIILCDELLFEIFHRLPPPSSSAVSLVSKRWLHLLRSSLSSLALRISPNNLSLSTFTSFLSQHIYLTSLTITTSATGITTVFSDDLLISISTSCRNLTRLRLCTGPISLFPLLSLSTSCPKLSSLSIILSRPLISLHFISYFPNLKTLTLTLVGNASLGSNSDHYTVYTSSPTQLQLQSLSLSGIRANDYAVGYLWRNCSYETITKLVFENCDGVGDSYSFSSFLKGLKNLHELELKICRSIISLILHKLAENRCEFLSSLLIYDGGTKEGLLSFIRESNCNLQILDLRLPLDLDDSHLLEIGTKFNRLRVLRLQSCCMVTGEGLKTLGLALSNSLEELCLTNCDVIKRQSGILVELAQNLRNIKILDLSYNHMLLDKEFVSMISSYGGLRRLKLRGCSRLTDVSLILLCKNCKCLESIDIGYCHGFQVQGVEFVILNSPELRKVQVEDCKLSKVARRWMVNKFIEAET